MTNIKGDWALLPLAKALSAAAARLEAGGASTKRFFGS